MKIKDVSSKLVIVINGKEYIREEQDWVESIQDAKKDGVTFDSVEDIFNWIEEY